MRFCFECGSQNIYVSVLTGEHICKERRHNQVGMKIWPRPWHQSDVEILTCPKCGKDQEAPGNVGDNCFYIGSVDGPPKVIFKVFFLVEVPVA